MELGGHWQGGDRVLGQRCKGRAWRMQWRCNGGSGRRRLGRLQCVLLQQEICLLCPLQWSLQWLLLLLDQHLCKSW